MKFVISRAGAYATSLLSHILLLILGVSGLFGTPLGDITNTYEPWSKQMTDQLTLFGIDTDWVYPWVDLVPILGPRVLADATRFSYFGMWITGSIIVDLVALWALLGWSGTPSRQRLLAGFGWIGLQFLLGPVAISRLDNLSVALAVIALAAMFNGKDAIAARWLAFATWVKLWPAALLLGLIAATKDRKKVFEHSQAVLIGIALLGFLLGRFHAFSFFSAQSQRGIQIEAPIALLWLWQKIFGSQSATIYYDQTYLTFQVQGDGVELFAILIGLTFYVALAITAFLAYRGAKQGADRNQLFAWTALTAILDILVFNKVGSPQYMGWLFIPVIFAIATSLKGWKSIGYTVALLSFLTFLIYPVTYDGILSAMLLPTLTLTARNLILIFLLVQANLELTKLGQKVSDERANEVTLD